LAAELSKYGVVEEAFEGYSFEDGFAQHDAEYFAGNFEEFLHVLVEVELIIGLFGIAETENVEFRIEYFLDAKVHPFSEQSARVAGVFLFFEDDFDFLVEVDGLELVVAGHEEVVAVDQEVVGLAGGPGDAVFLEVVAEPGAFLLEAAVAHDGAAEAGDGGRDAVGGFGDPVELFPGIEVFGDLNGIGVTLISMN
jgi:hypothetical protein